MLFNELNDKSRGNKWMIRAWSKFISLDSRPWLNCRGNFAFYHCWTASNCYIWMFLTNSNQYLLTKYYLCRATYFAYTPQRNLTILPCKVAHLPTKTGTGESHLPTPPLAPGLAFFIDSNGTLNEETIYIFSSRSI